MMQNVLLYRSLLVGVKTVQCNSEAWWMNKYFAH